MLVILHSGTSCSSWKLRCTAHRLPPAQEFNICFTTVERGEEGAAPELPPPARDPAPLPVILAAILQVPPRSGPTPYLNC